MRSSWSRVCETQNNRFDIFSLIIFYINIFMIVILLSHNLTSCMRMHVCMYRLHPKFSMISKQLLYVSFKLAADNVLVRYVVRVFVCLFVCAHAFIKTFRHSARCTIDIFLLSYCTKTRHFHEDPSTFIMVRYLLLLIRIHSGGVAGGLG